MARAFKFEVLEDEEYLERSLQQARRVSQKEKLQMLLWIKRGAVKQQQELGQRLGRDTSTISRWLQRYRQGGLAKLLEQRKAPGKAWEIEGEILAQLEAQLQQPEGFRSYGEIVEWLKHRFGKTLKYQTVYKTVRYRLKAKLKVPRPRSMKQDEQTVELFKKTSRWRC
jgi:transposase